MGNLGTGSLGTAVLIAARLIAAGLALFWLMLVSAGSGAEVTGRVLGGIACAELLSILVTMNTESGALRQLTGGTDARARAEARGFVRFCLGLALGVGTLIGGLMVAGSLLAEPLREWVAPGSGWQIGAAIGAAIPAVALARVQARLGTALGRPLVTALPRLLLPGAALLACALWREAVSATDLLWAFAGAYIAVVPLQALGLFWRPALPRAPKPADAPKAGPPKAGPPKAGPMRAGPPKAGPPKASPMRAGPLKAGPIQTALWRQWVGAGLLMVPALGLQEYRRSLLIAAAAVALPAEALGRFGIVLSLTGFVFFALTAVDTIHAARLGRSLRTGDAARRDRLLQRMGLLRLAVAVSGICGLGLAAILASSDRARAWRDAGTDAWLPAVFDPGLLAVAMVILAVPLVQALAGPAGLMLTVSGAFATLFRTALAGLCLTVALTASGAIAGGLAWPDPSALLDAATSTRSEAVMSQPALFGAALGAALGLSLHALALRRALRRLGQPDPALRAVRKRLR
ncbi:MAG: hypothetical protein AAGE13_09095 [Pseudomonadota bacterium]